MSSTSTIPIEKFARRIGIPSCPAAITVCASEDFGADPRLIPTSLRGGQLQSWRRAEEPGAESANVASRQGLNRGYGAGRSPRDYQPDSLAEIIAWLARQTRRWMQLHLQRQALKELAELDSDRLRDIGISREDALREAAKPFWR